MKRILAAPLLLTLLLIPEPLQASHILTADLEAAHVVPSSTSTATGVAFVFPFPDNSLFYSVVATGFDRSRDRVVTAEIRLGGTGTQGPVFKTLDVDATGNGSGFVNLTAGEMAVFLRREYYILLTSTNRPAGALRGQIVDHPGRSWRYFAFLAGDLQIPPNNSGALSIVDMFYNPTGKKLAYCMISFGFRDNVTGSGVHVGTAYEDGPQLLSLETDREGNGSGLLLLTPEQATILEQNEVYVNLRSKGFPQGETRGQMEPDPGHSRLHVVSRTPTGVQRIHFETGPSIIDLEAQFFGELFPLVEYALAVGEPDIRVIPAFDPAEFADPPPTVRIVTVPVLIDTTEQFCVTPGLFLPLSEFPSGISQADFLNVYYSHYTVSFDSLNVNQSSSRPILFGPLVVGGPQLGGPASSPSATVTAFNSIFRIATTGDYTVRLRWKTRKTIDTAETFLPAADYELILPVKVVGPRGSLFDTRPTAAHRGHLTRTLTRLRDLIPKAFETAGADSRRTYP